MNSFLLTKSRIAFITAVLGIVATIAAGGAKIALSESKLAAVDSRTIALEKDRETQGLAIERINTTLDGMKDTLNRIEDHLENNRSPGR